MRGGRIVSVTLVAVLLMGLAPSSGALPPPSPLTTLGVSLAGPDGVGVNILGNFSGRVNTVLSAGVPQATVTLLRDGAPVATLLTDEAGRYRHSMPISPVPGDFTFTAHARTPGPVMAGDSPPLVVKVRARPLAPESATAVQDGSVRAAIVTWTATTDTRDAPLLSYRVTRAPLEGPSQVLAIVNNTTLSVRDDTVGWGASYRYFVQAITFAGASPPSPLAPLEMPNATVGDVDVGTPQAVLCAPTCQSVHAGDHTLSGPSLRIRPFVSGRVTDAFGEGLGAQDVAIALDLTVVCSGCTPSSAHAEMTARTSGSGRFERQPFEHTSTGFATGECRSFRFDAVAMSVHVTGTGTDTFRVCRTT